MALTENEKLQWKERIELKMAAVIEPLLSTIDQDAEQEVIKSRGLEEDLKIFGQLESDLRELTQKRDVLLDSIGWKLFGENMLLPPYGIDPEDVGRQIAELAQDFLEHTEESHPLDQQIEELKAAKVLFMNEVMQAHSFKEVTDTWEKVLGLLGEAE